MSIKGYVPFAWETLGVLAKVRSAGRIQQQGERTSTRQQVTRRTVPMTSAMLRPGA
jgi:hypothetical protein